jgi:hypothetical protein
LMNEAALFPFKITSLASCFLSALCLAWLMWRMSSPGHACSTNQVTHDAVRGWISPIGKPGGPWPPHAQEAVAGAPWDLRLRWRLILACWAPRWAGSEGPSVQRPHPQVDTVCLLILLKATVSLVLRGLGCVEWFGRGC